MSECIFCKIVTGEAKSWKVYEDETTYAFFDIHPINEYHTLVIPKNHFENMFDIPTEELINVMTTVKKLVDLYQSKLGINNVQLLNSSGVEAQQDVFHLHFHIVPRKKGDNQDRKWITYPEWTEKFDQLLERLLT